MSALCRRWGHALLGSRGFSATEATTILAALAILSGVVAPSINDYIEDAKLIRARHDVTTIGVSMIRLFNDVQRAPSTPGHWAAYDLLVGAGDMPRAASSRAAAWATPAGLPNVGWLDDHLITNASGYQPRQASHGFGWRGAYLQKPVGADPWGHRYAVNVGVMREHGSDLLVISSASDGVVTVPFEADGLHLTSDDIVMVVSSGGVGR